MQNRLFAAVIPFNGNARSGAKPAHGRQSAGQRQLQILRVQQPVETLSRVIAGSDISIHSLMFRLLNEGHISLVASYGADRAEQAILIVDQSDRHGKAKVSLLHRYERSQ